MATPSNPINQLLHDEVALDDDDTQLAVDDVDTEEEVMMSRTLFAAAMLGNLDIIRENERFLSTRLTRTGNSVLHIASDFGRLQCVKEIIQLLHKRNANAAAELLKKSNNKGETTLHVAAKRGHLSIVEQLLLNFAHQQHNDDDVENELVVTADPDHDHHITELLRMTNKKGSTALHEAARYGVVKENALYNMMRYNGSKDSGVVKYLTSKDSNYAYSPNLAGETPLYIATESRHQVAAIAILRTCKSPAYQGPLGRNALHAAIISNSQDVIEEIMNRRPNLARKKDEDDWSPLHWAAFYNRSTMVTQLLSYDKSLAYIPDENGLIPLHVAGSRGNISAVISFISNCPDCYDIVDNKGRNVIHHAVVNRQLGFVTEVSTTPLFFRLVNEGDEDGNTPLHLHPDPFVPPSFILPRGVDPFAVNADGLTIKEAFSRRHSFNIETLYKPIARTIETRRPRKPSSGGITGQLKVRSGESDEEGERFKMEIDDSHLIVAALVATVAFAAGFTAPGGYDDKTGVAKLSDTFGFRCFIVFDGFALMLSFSAILLYFNSVYHINQRKLLAYILVTCANLLTLLGIFSTVIAFVAAVALTTGSSEISVTIIVSGVVFFVFFFGIIHQLVIIGFVRRGHSFWGLFTPLLTSRRLRVTIGDR